MLFVSLYDTLGSDFIISRLLGNNLYDTTSRLACLAGLWVLYFGRLVLYYNRLVCWLVVKAKLLKVLYLELFDVDHSLIFSVCLVSERYGVLSSARCWSPDYLYLFAFQFRPRLLYLDMGYWWVMTIWVIWWSTLEEFLIYHWFLVEKLYVISLWKLRFDVRLWHNFGRLLFNHQSGLAALRLASLVVLQLFAPNIWSFIKRRCRIMLCCPTIWSLAQADSSWCLLFRAVEADSFFLQIELELLINIKVVLWDLHQILALRDLTLRLKLWFKYHHLLVLLPNWV